MSFIKKQLRYSGMYAFLILFNIASSAEKIGSSVPEPVVPDEFVFFPNEKCTVAAYNDSINCGTSSAVLVNNAQGAIWCEYRLVRSRNVLDEVFIGVEIVLKDTNGVIDISQYDSVYADIVHLNSDFSENNFKIQGKSRLSDLSKLPPADTLPCGHPLKLPNRRHPYSIIEKQIAIEKNRFRYTVPVDSFGVPNWYNASLYKERFNKRRFYSISIQSGSTVPINQDKFFVITRIGFKKSITTGEATAMTAASPGQDRLVIPPLFIISGCMLFSMIAVIVYLRRKRPAADSGKKVIEYINNNYNDVSLTEDKIATDVGISRTIADEMVRSAKQMGVIDYLHFVRVETEVAYLFEKNHREKIDKKKNNTGEKYADDRTNKLRSNVRMPFKINDDDAEKVIPFFRKYYEDSLHKDDKEKKDLDDKFIEDTIQATTGCSKERIVEIVRRYFGESGKKNPLIGLHLKRIRIGVAKKIMKYYMELHITAVPSIKELSFEVGFKEQDRFNKAWDDIHDKFDETTGKAETPTRFQEREIKENLNPV